ncbi:MAG: hypothetical protein HPY96_05910 [Bacilli bacterium]|jgi:putative membrane protein|nr:hypothetical protein [Bacilli bacterium]
MNRKEFCKHHWEYYLVLEKDFLQSERYVSFELGEDYLYDGIEHDNCGNSKTFSNEFIKQYQAICSEVDVILKSICLELGNQSANDMKNGYTPIVLQNWVNINAQKVRFKDLELQPFSNWQQEPNYKSPDWWTPYNNVKHERLFNYHKANLKNVLNALAGLYILENYLVKFIGDRDNDSDVPNDISLIFGMIDFETRETVIGKDSYLITSKDIDELWK